MPQATPNTAWAAELAKWAIPDAVLAAAAVSPYFFDRDTFVRASESALERADDTPSDQAARAALPANGTVLDVGVGGGAASLRLAAARIIGVDTSADMLDAFSEVARRRGVVATTVQGTWPEVAPATPPGDVAVCHHVIYNVADLEGFARALTDHARARIVVEFTAEHPMTWLAPYWQALHGWTQPDRPTAADALDVLLAVAPWLTVERWRRPIHVLGEDEDGIERLARRLCLPADRHDELRALLAQHPPPDERDIVTVWWDRPTA